MTTNVSAELNNQQSPLYQWLHGRMSNGGFKIINNHNYLMANNYHQLIKPSSWDIDFPLIGTAINYAVYYYLLGNLVDHIEQSAAGRGACKLGLIDQLISTLHKTLTMRELAIACIILAALEAKGRGREHDLLRSIKYDGNYLPIDDSFWQGYRETVDDVENLICAAIPSLIVTLPELFSQSVRINALFAGSEYIHADAQLIVDGILIDVRTTTKKKPFTIVNFFQQITYCLMDWDNQYNINSLLWFYPRQQAVFQYPIERLFKNITTLRQEFREFVETNYENEADLLLDYADLVDW